MPFRITLLFMLLLASVLGEETRKRGHVIYGKLCAECHGPRGQGVADEYDEPLFGDRTIPDLAKLIHRTMPEDDAALCEDDDAQAVAAFIYDTFYSEAARARNKPVRVELARLTASQFQQSAADLVGSFRRTRELGEERGLKASYYDGRRARRDQRKLERVDSEVRFNFKNGSPVPKEIKAEAFAIEWEGSVIAPETGVYEFIVRTENGFRLSVNGDSDKPLIDGWVSSGKMREERASVTLLGGRAYPLELEYFKFKGKSASIELNWKPPNGVDRVIPNYLLVPLRVSPVMVVSTAFPADDSSMGYVRGTAVSKAWHAATTSASIEAANYVVANLASLAGAKPNSEGWAGDVQEFATRFVSRAFRRPLNEEESEFYVRRHFDVEVKPDVAVKRVVILTLSSPHFLYPEMLASNGVDSGDVASRLALYLRDSLPDEQAGKMVFDDPKMVRDEATRLLDHSLTRAKIRGFFHHWLHIEGELDLAKDPKLFPEFDQETIVEMRRSLDVFIDDVVWNESSDYRELLLADYLYLNAKLADFIGEGTFKGSDFRKVHFDPKARAGVLTHPYLLARFAYHRTTSPIHRGVFVTRNVLGRSLKPPPEAVKFEESRFDPHLTMREKVTELTKSKACMNCHSMINPLGFSLERFDAVGRFRFEEKNRPIEIEASYEAPDGKRIAINGARDVAEHAATNREAQRGFIQHLFEHLVKQPCNAYGLDTLDSLHDGFVESGFHIQKLIVSIVTAAACHQLDTLNTQES
ncbi:DUF1588 domain-containing protein [Verrucomicrobiales bacterium]|nr:DUF1588 domain-containing protein [Verrucomicrobiales bacterium]